MKVGIEGRVNGGMIGRAAHASPFCMWLLCNYCRLSVSTVLLHCMKDSYLLYLEGAFYFLNYIRY